VRGARLTERQHDARHAAQVGFAAMPETQVSDNDAALLDGWLRWWADFSTAFKNRGLDSAACAIAMFAFLVGDRGAVVGAKPYLSGPVFDLHLDQWDVDDEGEWD